MMRINTHKGFTLIEVLVATVIMGIGMMGVVAMHGTAMHFTKDSESQWVASSNVFSLFDSMRARLHPKLSGQFSGRAATALTELRKYAVPGPGGVGNNCPVEVKTEAEELQCLQRHLESALPGGRIERIVVPSPVEGGITVEVSWLLTINSEDGMAECEAMEQDDVNADVSIRSGISATDGCSSTNPRRVASWVMVP